MGEMEASGGFSPLLTRSQAAADGPSSHFAKAEEKREKEKLLSPTGPFLYFSIHRYMPASEENSFDFFSLFLFNSFRKLLPPTAGSYKFPRFSMTANGSRRKENGICISGKSSLAHSRFENIEDNRFYFRFPFFTIERV